MSRQSGFQNAFNVGEIGPDAWARSDLAQHSKGCVMGFNMIGRVAGPTGRRNGTWYCGAPKSHDAAARLVPFRRSLGDALFLEFGHLYVRVWTVNGTPVMTESAPVEFASPYTAAQLDGLLWRQIGDVVYLTHRAGLRPYTLRRLSNTSWTITDTVFGDGPWRGENADETKILTLTSGVLTSNFDLFQPGHVGALFRLRKNSGNPGALSWEPGEENVGEGQLRLSDGRVYARTGGSSTSGNTPPVHDAGTVSDGSAEWTFHDDGASVLIVSSHVSPTQVNVIGLSGVPDMLETGTFNWAESAYSEVRGWPTAPVAVREERLIMAAPRGEPDAVDFTRTAGFSPARLDFKPGLGTGRVVDDDAVRRFVGDERNRIAWLAGSTFLMCGTTDGEFVITGATLDDPISPAGNVARPISDYGSTDALPVLVQKGVMFVAAGGETLVSIQMGPDQVMEDRDLNVVAEHIGQRGLAELTWLKQPHNLLWVRLADGGQASFTYHAKQGVEGWNRHGVAATQAPTEYAPLGGGMVLESSCVVPGINGRPRLFMLARRAKAGSTQRMILRMAEREEKLFLDAAELYAGGAQNGVIGLDHLANEPVTVMAATGASPPSAPGPGWGEYRDRTVAADGTVLLPETVIATRMYVGLPFLSRWEGLPPDLMGPGSSAGRKVQYTHASIVLEAGVAYAGTTGDEGDSGTDRFLSREPLDVDGPVLRRRAWRPAMLGGASPDRRYFVQTDHGWDLVIHSIRATADVNG